MTPSTLRQWSRKVKSAKLPFRDFVKLPKEELELSGHFSDVEKSVIESAIEAMPKLTLEAKATVKGSDKIFEGDVLTIDVTITRKGAGTDQVNGIHSNHYPYPKQEIFWLVVTSNEQQRVVDYAKISRPFTTVHKEYMVLVEKVSTRGKRSPAAMNSRYILRLIATAALIASSRCWSMLTLWHIDLRRKRSLIQKTPNPVSWSR